MRTPTPQRPTLSARIPAFLLRPVVRLLARLHPVTASNLAGWLARTLGPRLAVSRVADRNLQAAFPDLASARRAAIIRGVWDNLGRTYGELPHLARLHRTGTGPGWELVGLEHLQAIQGRQAIFFSGHFGNWEMILPIAAQFGFPVAGIYRAASNPGVDALIRALRQQATGDQVPMFAKGAAGAKAALRHLATGASLGLLVDQKMNDGIAVPFLGRAAMTAPALAQLALRFRTPVVPVRIDRLGPARLRMVVEAPLPLPASGDRQEDVAALMLAVNQTLERWVRADPASWLWLHRRWPKRPS